MSNANSPFERPTLEPEWHPDESLRLLIRLLRSSSAIKNRIRVRLDEEYQMTLPQWDMITALERHPKGITMTALSRALMVSNGNVTSVVNRLVAAGLVLRQDNFEDRRVATARLTRKGKQVFQEIAAANKRWVDQMLLGISDAEVSELNKLLVVLRRSVEQHMK